MDSAFGITVHVKAASCGAPALLGVVFPDNTAVAKLGVKYSPDGESGALASPFGFTGQVYIEALELYYYKARMYSPKAARFLSPDPIGYADGMNLYAYVSGDPINRVDPFGMNDLCFTNRGKASITVTFEDDSSDSGSRPYSSETCFAQAELVAFPGNTTPNSVGPPQETATCRVPTQTPRQRQIARSGNREAYFQSRRNAGDPFADLALRIATDSGLRAHLANGRLFVAIVERNNASVNLTMGLADVRTLQNQIGVELMQAYSRQLDATGGMTLSLWTDIHHDVFARHNMSPETYGGTPFGGYGITLMNALFSIDGCL